jgi:hypothetical protein
MKIKSIKEVAPRTVYAVATTSGTYIADGLAHHNCIGCNTNPPYGKGGNYVEYFVFMEKEWGRDMIEEFRALKYQTIKYKVYDYERIEQEYKEKTEALCKR